MNEDLHPIIKQFIPTFVGHVVPITNGLINHTYKVNSNNNTAYILQQINTTIFTQPALLQQNYTTIAAALVTANSSFCLPAMLHTCNKQLLFIDELKQCWRMFYFVQNACTNEHVQCAEDAYKVAHTFSQFTTDVKNVTGNLLHVVLPNFHNLPYRYQQLTQAIQYNKSNRLQYATAVLHPLQVYQPLLKMYALFTTDQKKYRQYILHHDAKISNILFNKITGKTITPIDFDTTMPGYFFSDVGDMIRSMAVNKNENDVEYKGIQIIPENYQAILEGYLNNMNAVFTNTEIQQIHYSGLIILYMQCLRFITDYINGDMYYQVIYPQQNFDRAFNQLTCLQLLHSFLKTKYGIKW
jgi:thiamine kinase-like enzyme